MFEWNAEQQSEWLPLLYAQNEFLIVPMVRRGTGSLSSRAVAGAIWSEIFVIVVYAGSFWGRTKSSSRA